jgi:sterol 3beta-glucosyltransferase
MFWGERVAALGAGPSPLPVKRLTVPALAARVATAVNDPSIRAHAAAAGRRIRAENGAGHACSIIEALL